MTKLHENRLSNLTPGLVQSMHPHVVSTGLIWTALKVVHTYDTPRLDEVTWRFVAFKNPTDGHHTIV